MMTATKTSHRLFLIMAIGITIVSAAHFRGGTLNWKPTGVENQASLT